MGNKTQIKKEVRKMKNQKQKNVKTITEKEYQNLHPDFRGSCQDYYGDHPEWKGRRIAAFPCELPGLFIEGVNLKII